MHILGRFDVYNLITTSIWIVEVGTSLWLSSRNRDRLTCAQFIELCFALFLCGNSLYFVISNHEPPSLAHWISTLSNDDNIDSSKNNTATASTTAASTTADNSSVDSITTINLNITFMLLDICVKTVAFSYAFILVLQRFRQRQVTEFQEVAWWEDVSYGGTIPPDVMSQRSNNTMVHFNKANMVIKDRSESHDSQSHCTHLMTIYGRKHSADASAITHIE